jgi:hypothetical protein
MKERVEGEVGALGEVEGIPAPGNGRSDGKIVVALREQLLFERIVANTHRRFLAEGCKVSLPSLLTEEWTGIGLKLLRAEGSPLQLSQRGRTGCYLIGGWIIQ